jgi:hypothetical protein
MLNNKRKKNIELPLLFLEEESVPRLNMNLGECSKDLLTSDNQSPSPPWEILSTWQKSHRRATPKPR